MIFDRPIIVIGAGGHSKVLLDILLQQNAQIIGIVEDDFNKFDNQILGVKIVGNDDYILNYSPKKIYLVNAIGSAGSMNLRKKIFLKFKQEGYEFARVIHPTAVIGQTVIIQEGAQIMAGAIIQIGSSVGINSIINTKASVDHDCKIKEHVHISPGTIICGNCTVGSCTHVGAGTTIIQNINIGEEVLIGAGSVVVKDIPAKVKAFGVPAKSIGNMSKVKKEK